jgi:hypothetical protein
MSPCHSGPHPAAFSEQDIAAQFEGVEVEFDDKVTLFPVQVEKDERPRRRTVHELRRPQGKR